MNHTFKRTLSFVMDPGGLYFCVDHIVEACCNGLAQLFMHPNTSQTTTTMTTTPPELPPLSGSTDKESKEAWAKRYNTNQCAICIAPWTKGDRIVLTQPCSHLFHMRCLDTWTHERAPFITPTLDGVIEVPCPICREHIHSNRHVVAQ